MSRDDHDPLQHLAKVQMVSLIAASLIGDGRNCNVALVRSSVQTAIKIVNEADRQICRRGKDPEDFV